MRGDDPPAGWAPGVSLADLGCPDRLDERWAKLPIIRWYMPADWRPEVVVQDRVDLALPSGTPADCVGVRLGLVDKDGQPVAVPVRIESAGRWTILVEDGALSIRLAERGR